jgi:hypothetical protein
MLGMYLLALIVNYANFLIKKKFENIIAFLPFVLQDWCFWFGLLWSFKITLLSGAVLDTLVLQPVGFNTNVNFSRILSFKFQVSKSNFYLDSSLQSKVEEANASDLS